jgi:hypothetical protein
MPRDLCETKRQEASRPDRTGDVGGFFDLRMAGERPHRLGQTDVI